MTRWLMVLLLTAPMLVAADVFDDAVSKESRPEADRARDALRTPAKVLRAIGPLEGLTVLDMGAGGGYYSELFADLVGDDGQVYLQNPSTIYEIFPNLKPALTGQRLADDRLPNAHLLEDEAVSLSLDDASVDLVFFHLIYHDQFWLYADQMDAVNGEIKRVLKPGGRLVIIDHDAADGSGNKESLAREGTAHRLEDDYAKKLLTGAGFKLVKESDALRVAEDDHTKPFFDESLRGKPTDRFFHIYER